jgi:hypothetical protein
MEINKPVNTNELFTLFDNEHLAVVIFKEDVVVVVLTVLVVILTDTESKIF